MAEDHRFRSITEIWLEGDHYKWRAMRTNGVPERFCSGDASDWEKFEAWARTVPETLGNPLFHWTAMELRRPFGIETLLSPETARPIYEHANARLKEDAFTALGLLAQFKVAVVCSTDDPTDTLECARGAREAQGPADAGLPDLAAGQGRARRGPRRLARLGRRSSSRPRRPRSAAGTSCSPPSRSATPSSTSWAAGPPTTGSR